MNQTILAKNLISKEDFNFKDLPDDLRISTMTITCSFNTLIDTKNVGKYIDLSFGGIVCVKYKTNNNRSDYNMLTRSLIKLKKIRKNKKNKKRKNFFNQATLIVDVKNKRRINVKVFKNGSLQMTGCRSIDDFETALNIVCNELRKKKAVYNKITQKIEKRSYLTNYEEMDVNKMINFKVRMINSNFNVGIKIDREKLYELISKSTTRCIYEPCIHACVNIKYLYKEKDIISIFVFESGSIIITGAKIKDHIVEAYKFITKVLFENYDKIIRKNFDELLERDDIKLLIEQSKAIEVE
jgi:TATA-box binding protein (TBP) (component of TFIID and TFIIIB)